MTCTPLPAASKARSLHSASVRSNYLLHSMIWWLDDQVTRDTCKNNKKCCIFNVFYTPSIALFFAQSKSSTVAAARCREQQLFTAQATCGGPWRRVSVINCIGHWFSLLVARRQAWKRATNASWVITRLCWSQHRSWLQQKRDLTRPSPSPGAEYSVNYISIVPSHYIDHDTHQDEDKTNKNQKDSPRKHSQEATMTNW